MRGKRSKQYRKLMQQYGLHFGFREPYQVLLDDGILRDAARFKMNFLHMIEKTLHGKIRPMITHCTLRALLSSLPRDSPLIPHAKAIERRRCNHAEPLQPTECIRNVVDPKGSKTNKHHYCVASQDDELRAALRDIPSVPIVHIHRSVMVMEPMSEAGEKMREAEEGRKFGEGLKGKRKRGVGEGEGDTRGEVEERSTAAKKRRGPSGPNPLSVKKRKEKPREVEIEGTGMRASMPVANGDSGLESGLKRRRKRKKKVDVAEQSLASHEDSIMIPQDSE